MSLCRVLRDILEFTTIYVGGHVYRYSGVTRHQCDEAIWQGEVESVSLPVPAVMFISHVMWSSCLVSLFPYLPQACLFMGSIYMAPRHYICYSLARYVIMIRRHIITCEKLVYWGNIQRWRYHQETTTTTTTYICSLSLYETYSLWWNRTGTIYLQDSNVYQL